MRSGKIPDEQNRLRLLLKPISIKGIELQFDRGH